MKRSVLLLALRRWQLPPGAIAFMLGLNAILTIYSAPRSDTNAPVPLIAAMLSAAIAADVAYALLRPSMQRTLAMRAFTFVLPVITTSFYFLVLELAGGIWWYVHVWSGAIVLAGGMGLLVSFLVVPPRGLAELS